jgi:histidyl-tRNA synthetase
MANTNPARGMRDFLPSDVRKRNYVIGIIKEVYESYGFEPLETPAVENIETLMGKYGDEGNQLIFKVLKRGEKLERVSGSKARITLENTTSMRIYIRNIMRTTNEAFNDGVISNAALREIAESMRLLSNSLDAYEVVELSDLALRYDLTVPLARVVANNKNELPKFFKRYQIQPVWRADRPARGRFREFYQCDVDCIGSESMVVEAELISAVSEILQQLGFGNFSFRLNHRKYLTGVLEYVGVPVNLRDDALVAIDKFDKIGFDGVLDELLKRGVSEEKSEKLVHFFKFAQDYDPMMEGAIAIKLSDANISDFEREELQARRNEAKNIGWLEESRKFLLNSTIGLDGLNEVERIMDFTKPSGAFRFIRFDPSLARGLSYYTGTIMEINVPDLAGSLGGGGRYDGLIGMFGKEQIPACGFSLGLERILVVMEERGMFPPEIADSTPADVMVTISSEETVSESLKLAAELRKQGLRVTVFPEADKLGKQLKYADSIKVPWVCFLGEKEIMEGNVTLKNMKTSEQIVSPIREIANRMMK